MKVLLNKEGYVESYALEGDLTAAIECSEPDDMIAFENHFASFRVRDGTLLLDTERLKALSDAEVLTAFRTQRAVECFPVINRGQLWYDRLTAEQRKELQLWYQAWLDVTQTQTIPAKPKWLK